MTVEKATFMMLPDDPPRGPWVMQVIMEGSGMEDRAVPIVATVGDLTMQVIRVSPDGTRAAGLLMGVPPVGAELRVGYLNQPELDNTDITFQPEEA